LAAAFVFGSKADGAADLDDHLGHGTHAGDQLVELGQRLLPLPSSSHMQVQHGGAGVVAVHGF
jgi:hypothetical protein